MLLFSIEALPCCGDEIFSALRESFAQNGAVAVLQQSRGRTTEDPHGLSAILEDSLQLARIARSDDACGGNTVVLALRPFTADGVLPRTRAMLRLRQKLKAALARALRLPTRRVVFFVRGDVHDCFARVVEDETLAHVTLADMYDTAGSLESLFSRAPPRDTIVYATSAPPGSESSRASCASLAAEVSSCLQRHVAEALVGTSTHREGFDVPGWDEGSGVVASWAPPVQQIC